MDKTLKPREKLIKHGPKVLSNSELIAILLRTGTKDKPVLKLAKDVIDILSSIQSLKNISVFDLLSIKGISHAKATTIVAAVELGNRIRDNSLNNKKEIETINDVYDYLREGNPEIYKSKDSIHNLNIFLSRLLFCFFAEDTEIFDEESIFTNTLAQQTNPNGSDTHVFLNDLFKRLNTEKKDGLPDYLIDFPYVNGGLFKDPIKSPKFSSKARKVLLELGDLDWKDINPDIFGSMIQAVVIDEYRSDLGMHYTSVPNILKVIKPLFLDELYEEYEKHENSIAQLRKLINRISKIKFFDPACGSGNFLIITYKEIRVLEIKILKQIIDLSPTPQLEFTQIRLS